MYMEAFESSKRASVREVLGQRPSPSDVMLLQSSPVNVMREPVPLPLSLGPVFPQSSGLTVPEMIDGDVPGKKITVSIIKDHEETCIFWETDFSPGFALG